MKPNQNKRQKIFKKYEGRCAYCGEQSALLTLDHIHPDSKGGTWKLTNLNPACPDCNHAKGTLSIDAFRQEIATRKDPAYAPPMNHMVRRALARHPGCGAKPYQSKQWLNTLKKFDIPVVFFFEQVPERPNQTLLTAVMSVLAPRKPSEPVYYSMGGFGSLSDRTSL